MKYLQAESFGLVLVPFVIDSEMEMLNALNPEIEWPHLVQKVAQGELVSQAARKLSRGA